MSDAFVTRLSAVAETAGADIALVNRRVDQLKVWTLRGVLAGAAAVIAFLADKMWVGH